ncbi:MAG TPA: DNA primase, partial [Phycicoccus sp.]|nr:DNA primase [Phycicoccus sp.]
MPGRIRAEDITAVKERTSIEDVVRDHVTLRPGGVGSLKGLCPFHDEKTPSFTVRPSVGSYHCFGCGEGGDVISFVQKVEHLTFSEAVERLAAKAGMELRYEEGGGPRDSGATLGKRQRLLEAHRVAEEFYTGILLDRARGDARTGRDFLRDRGFDSAAVTRFGVGFAPQDGEALTRHLLQRGFTDDELVAGGLSGRGSRGLYDRFRGRLVWPIRDTTGDTVGFGARRLFEDDRIAAKYLNTSETPIYRKSQVLYGLDLAKKAIAGERRAVVVEGYTDVMAAHLSGVEGAVATCGTAFGIEHIKILRRIMRDETDG